MHLYLIRHGEAVSVETDPSRPLSEAGRSQVYKLAGFLRGSEINIDEIWVSDKLRAKQTAEMIAKETSVKKVLEKSGLSPNDHIVDILEAVYRSDKDIAIVGHLPFLSKLLSQILTSNEDYDIVKFDEAGAVCLQRGEIEWQISWVVSPVSLA